MGALQMGIILINGCPCICSGPARVTLRPSLRHPHGAPPGRRESRRYNEGRRPYMERLRGASGVPVQGSDSAPPGPLCCRCGHPGGAPEHVHTGDYVADREGQQERPGGHLQDGG